MKTKLFLVVIALAVISLISTYNNSYSQKKNSCCYEGSPCCTGIECCEKLSAGGASNDSVGSVCVVTAEKLEEGKGITYSYLGKDYKLCCEDCLDAFKNEPIKYTKDELTCVVMDEPVKKNISASYNGTKYYFCCKMCISQFNDSPEKYLSKFEKEK